MFQAEKDCPLVTVRNGTAFWGLGGHMMFFSIMMHLKECEGLN